MNEWVGLLQTFGLAVCILVFLGAGMWKTGGWVAENVVKPVVQRYINLLDALIASVVKQADALSRVGAVMEKLGSTMEKLGSTLDNMGQHSIKSMQNLDEIAQRISNIDHVRSVTVREAEHVDVHPRGPTASRP